MYASGVWRKSSRARSTKNGVMGKDIIRYVENAHGWRRSDGTYYYANDPVWDDNSRGMSVQLGIRWDGAGGVDVGGQASG